MPSIRGYIAEGWLNQLFFKEVLHTTFQAKMRALGTRLQHAASQAVNEPESDIEVFWQTFSKQTAVNMTDVSLDVQLSEKGRTPADFTRLREALLDVLETAEELPPGIEVGVWVFPAELSTYGMRKRA